MATTRSKLEQQQQQYTSRATPPLKGVRPQRPKRRDALAPDVQVASAAGNHPNFGYRGGAIINTPKVHALFVGDWSSAANQTRATRLQQFITDLLNSRYMNILSQYGCGTSGTLAGSAFVSAPDSELSAGDIHGVVQTAIDNSQVPEPTDPATCYILFLDDSTRVNDTADGVVMCEATSDNAFGFHEFFTTNAGNPAPFAVVPGLTTTCITDTCADDSTCSLHTAQTQEQRQTQVASHELSEMFSDPQPFTGWVDLVTPFESENGDICNGASGTITVGPNTWTVQQMYSKWHDMNTSGATTCIVDVANPLPSLLPAATFVLDRSTFGKDEIDALLALGNPGVIDAAFYLAVDGYNPAQLGITAASLVGTPNVAPTVNITPAVPGMSVSATSLVAEDPTLGGGIQRFTWVYRVSFTNTSGFPVNVGGVTPAALDTTVSSVSAPVLTAKAGAIMQLIHEPNPYEVDGPTSWLSTDARVFQINAGDSRFGATLGNSSADAATFIQQVIANLNAGSSAGQTFDDISTDENTSALELSQAVNGTNVFNFALARVRFRSLIGDATNVRAFFRLFPASTTSTDFETATTYRRGGQGGVTIPLLGIVGGEVTTIPCFATPRIDTTSQSMNAQTDPPNVQTILHDGTGNEVHAYFGCFVDINQPGEARFPISPSPVDGPYTSGSLKTIQELIRGVHQCLVAEIAFDPAPIGNGSSPASSDKLAQRNLSIVESDNPGALASHTIPNTFEVRRSPVNESAAFPPDELLIDWRSLPRGSEATLFFPGADATQIIETADELYASHHLKATDAHTISCTAQGVTYVPVPQGTGANLAGLMTVILPSTVRKGEAFKVVVRQVSNAAGKRIGRPPGAEPDAAVNSVVRFRRIVGSFQVSVPVRTKQVLLGPEERRLSVLRWIQQSIPAENRWSPVFTRYVDQIAGRVKALGGNPDQVLPSPRGEFKNGKEHERHVTGKVVEVLFGAFGEFEGFILDTNEARRRFHATDRGLANLILCACKDDFVITVDFESGRPEEIERIRIRSPRSL